MNTFKKAFVVLLFLITAGNTYISQQYPAVLFNIIVHKDGPSALSLLTKIQHDALFQDQITFLSQYIGIDFKLYFSNQKNIQQERVHHLDAMLQQNPNQPQVIHLLSEEYGRLGNMKKARILDQQAKELDPLTY